MGVYLSSPITDKISIDNTCKNFRYGASSMQGWRMTQEDAHNCLPDFDEEKDAAFFAVYDGHGGAEVAQYCAMNFPGYVKERQAYKEGNMKQALEDAFLDFDSTLIEESVVKSLRTLAGDDDNKNQEEEEDGAVPVGKSEADLLRQEASMPLDELLSKYEGVAPAPLRDIRKQQQDKILSPAIRSKKQVFGGSESEEADSSVKSGNLLGDENSSDTRDSNNSSDERNVNSSNVSHFPVAAAANLEDKLINGHADNENNLNKEKEILDSLNQQQHRSDRSERSEDAVSSSSSMVGGREAAARPGEADGQTVSQSESVSQSVDKTVTPSDSATTSQSRDKAMSQSCETSTSCAPGEADACPVAGDARDGIATSSSASSSSSAVAGPCSSSADEPCTSSTSVACSSGSSIDCEAGPSGSGSSSGRSAGGIMEADSDDDDDEDEEYEEESEEEEEEEEEDEEEEEEDGEEGFVNNPCMDMSNEEPGSDSGCTACVTVLLGRELYVANAGDSRCVLCRDGKAVDLSFDHKPEDVPERARIEKAGGKVTSDGRVNGGLNLSRAIGDHFYKRNHELSPREQMITSLPDVLITSLQDEDEFMVVACDGIWNFMSSQEVVDMVRQKLKDPLKRERLSIICEELFDYCLAPNTFGDGTGCDNMTCIIVTFNRPQREEMSPVPNNKRCANDMESSSSSEEKLEEKKAKVESTQDDSLS